MLDLSHSIISVPDSCAYVYQPVLMWLMITKWYGRNVEIEYFVVVNSALLILEVQTLLGINLPFNVKMVLYFGEFDEVS